MGIKMPLLGIVDFDNNVNPEIFNSVFRSIWSKRIYHFEISNLVFIFRAEELWGN